MPDKWSIRLETVERCGVRNLHGLHDLTGEVEVAGSVQHVDLTAIVLNGGHRGGDGNLAVDLFGIIITNGVSVGRIAQTGGTTGQKQHTLGQGGLSVATVSQQTDVADILYGIAHNLFPLLTFGIAEQHGKLLLSIIHESSVSYN